jgi:hypothetical protein
MGRIGRVLGAGVQSGNGVSVGQSVDPEIIKSVSYMTTVAQIIGRRSPLGPGTRVNVNRQKSELTAYQVELQQAGVDVTVTEADTFEALIYGADTAVNKLELPDDVIADIYFRDISGQDSISMIMADGVRFVAFINETIRTRGYTTVGGNIIPLYITPDLSGFADGEYGRLNLDTRQVESVGSTKVISGRLHYKDTDGTFKPYRSLLDIRAASDLSDEMQV